AESKENAEEDKKHKALELVMETVEALFDERGEEDKLWGSMVKQALRRRMPGFNESYYGFRSFSRLLEEAQDKKLLELELDEKSGSYIIKNVLHEE
ncbi:MAG: OST-HTH/LOTUS domain-containing protein, partial [Desulfomonilia bacterium]|nr:OST-HTH/LOTUS domain-containing protein [Desulfomonilia bacterium]